MFVCVRIIIMCLFMFTYVCAYVLTCSTRMCTHVHTYRILYIMVNYEKGTRKYVHCIFFNRQSVLDIERARAEEIATRPPPKQEIDMVCVCTYLCM